MFTAPIVAALLAPAAEPPKAAPFAVEEKLDVRYHDGSPRQALDVFRPRGVEGRPVVLFVHGGGWMFGDKDFFGLYRGVGRFLASKGYVAVLTNYRLSPTVRHPEHVKDVARAFAWTRRHIKDHGGDPDRIFLSGHSAGGHLVALLATDTTYLADPALGLQPADQTAVRGVMAVSGVYRIPGSDEFTAMMADLVTALVAADRPAARPGAAALARANDMNPFRIVFGEERGARAKASPLTYVRKDLPPFLVLYAERELPLLAPMAREFADALKEAGSPVEVQRVAGCHHNTILFRLHRADDPTARALLNFLDRHAGQRP